MIYRVNLSVIKRFNSEQLVYSDISWIPPIVSFSNNSIIWYHCLKKCFSLFLRIIKYSNKKEFFTYAYCLVKSVLYALKAVVYTTTVFTANMEIWNHGIRKEIRNSYLWKIGKLLGNFGLMSGKS